MQFKVSRSELNGINLQTYVERSVQEISNLYYNGNLVIYEMRESGSTRKMESIRFMLRCKSSYKEPARSAASGRRTNAANWEAHKRVMLYLFTAYPNAKLVSALATYDGLSDFQSRHGDTYHKNAGNAYKPVEFGSL